MPSHEPCYCSWCIVAGDGKYFRRPSGSGHLLRGGADGGAILSFDISRGGMNCRKPS